MSVKTVQRNSGTSSEVSAYISKGKEVYSFPDQFQDPSFSPSGVNTTPICILIWANLARDCCIWVSSCSLCGAEKLV